MPSLAMLVHSFEFVFIHKPRTISIIYTQASLRSCDHNCDDHSSFDFNLYSLFHLLLMLLP